MPGLRHCPAATNVAFGAGPHRLAPDRSPWPTGRHGAVARRSTHARHRPGSTSPRAGGDRGPGRRCSVNQPIGRSVILGLEVPGLPDRLVHRDRAGRLLCPRIAGRMPAPTRRPTSSAPAPVSHAAARPAGPGRGSVPRRTLARHLPGERASRSRSGSHLIRGRRTPGGKPIPQPGSRRTTPNASSLVTCGGTSRCIKLVSATLQGQTLRTGIAGPAAIGSASRYGIPVVAHGPLRPRVCPG